MINLSTTFPQLFKNYLLRIKLSPASIANYVADVNKFLQWSEENASYKSPDQQFLSYLQSLTEKGIKSASLKRYRSSLKIYGRFLSESGFLKSNPAQNLETINLATPSAKADDSLKLLDKFEKSLLKENLTKSTIVNYISDIKQFINWLHNNDQPK